MQKKLVLNVRNGFENDKFNLKPETVEIGGGVNERGEKIGSQREVLRNPPPQRLHNFYEAYVIKKRDSVGRYTGEFEFTSQDNPEAEIIMVRYMRGCHSLDAQWQKDNNRQPTDEELAGWSLNWGRNEFDLSKSDATWIRFIKHHSANLSNINRPHDAGSPIFYEIDSDKVVETKKKNFSLEKKILDEKILISDSDDKVLFVSKLFELSDSYGTSQKREKLLDIIEANSESYFQKIEDIEKGIKSNIIYLFQEGLVKIDEKSSKLYSSDMVELHSLVFKKTEPSKVSEDLAKKSLSDSDSYDKWLKIKKQFIK